MMRRIFCLSLFLLLATPVHAANDDWPKLEGDTDRPECQEALKLGREAFLSKSKQLHVSQNDSQSLMADENMPDATLKKVRHDLLEEIIDKYGEITLWQKNPYYNLRLVIYGENNGWRRSRYALYAVNGDMSKSQFDTARNDNSLKPITDEVEDQPSFFPTKDGKNLWVIDVGNNYFQLSKWTIYIVDQNGILPRCEVRFHPLTNEAINLLTLLPVQVQKFAQLMDGTLGNGSGDGSMHQTGRIRDEVRVTWANVAMRPWALADAFNTREEVDVNLKKWSRYTKSFYKLYMDIQQQYPLAEKDLTKYYQKNFGLTKSKAKRMSIFAIDTAQRTHFAFHSEFTYDPGRPPGPINPWDDITQK